MQPAFPRFAGLVLLLMLSAGAAGCDSDSTADAPTLPLPEPQTVAEEDISEPVAPSPNAGEVPERIYYLILDGRNDEVEGPEPLLEKLLARDVGLEEAWYPVLESIETPCAAPNVAPALVVQLDDPRSAALEELGFISDPRDLNPPIYPNCGVEEFEHYVFE